MPWPLKRGPGMTNLAPWASIGQKNQKVNNDFIYGYSTLGLKTKVTKTISLISILNIISYFVDFLKSLVPSHSRNIGNSLKSQEDTHPQLSLNEM